MSTHFTDFDAWLGWLRQQLPGPLRVAAPLALGKPHRLLNALYAHCKDNPGASLQLYTALSLNPPRVHGDGLRARFMRPFVERHFGTDFPRLAYADAMAEDTLPAHIRIEEFYLQSGTLLDSSQAQRACTSLNYNQVAGVVAQRAPNLLVQKVAVRQGQAGYSLSCNNDLTLDLLDVLHRRGQPRPLLVAEVDPQLPWLGGSAQVPADMFDAVITPPAPHPRLFALPRQPVSDADHAIGLYASTLVPDGGTLQIGIGALADALCHALVLRHTDNSRYRQLLDALDPGLQQHRLVAAIGGLEPFEQGLYGCSEMLNEGFRVLVEHGIIARRVHDDPVLMRRVESEHAWTADRATLAAEGHYLHGAFYLGSGDFYAWLRGLGTDQARAIDMRPISRINQLDGPDEALKRLQRRDARFYNSCMMATALGAAVSDALEDGRMVSGVGGQYNFVAMAHAMEDARSVLMLRASRHEAGAGHSNIRWQYGHTTIARHQRDIFINQYGIADLHGLCDEDCVIAMAGITEAPFQAALLAQARAAGKLAHGFAPPDSWQDNTASALSSRLAPFRHDGSLPDYPLGSDFTPVEQRLLAALAWLEPRSDTRSGALRCLIAALRQAPTDGDDSCLQRMGLDAPRGLRQWLWSRLLRLALARTAPAAASTHAHPH